MSMYLEFEPHSWYMGFAVEQTKIAKNDITNYPWNAYIDDGNTYRIVELHATTLSELKSKIRTYWLRDGGKHVPAFYAKRLLKRQRLENGEHDKLNEEDYI